MSAISAITEQPVATVVEPQQEQAESSWRSTARSIANVALFLTPFCLPDEWQEVGVMAMLGGALVDHYRGTCYAAPLAAGLVMRTVSVSVVRVSTYTQNAAATLGVTSLHFDNITSRIGTIFKNIGDYLTNSSLGIKANDACTAYILYGKYSAATTDNSATARPSQAAAKQAPIPAPASSEAQPPQEPKQLETEPSLVLSRGRRRR